MCEKLDDLKSTWLELGRYDPLWAVVTREDARGGRWNVTEFFATGERDVAIYHRLLVTFAHGPPRFRKVLDFGCGVGRFSRAWSRLADEVVGVDVSATMIKQGASLLGDTRNVTLVLNEKPDLARFADDQFDLVCSHICLQHIPWSLASAYLREFARVCARGGWVAFQLPTRRLKGYALADLRKAIIDHLPFGWDRAYRRWRHGCPVVFEMHWTAAEVVRATAEQAGLTEVHREPDCSAGDRLQSFIFIFRKPD